MAYRHIGGTTACQRPWKHPQPPQPPRWRAVGRSACQNGHLTVRCNTVGRPGHRHFAPRDRLFFFAFTSIWISTGDVSRRWVEPARFNGHEWQIFLREHNLPSSMSRRGNCYESFFQLLKCERIRRQIYPTCEAARSDVFNDRSVPRCLLKIIAASWVSCFQMSRSHCPWACPQNPHLPSSARYRQH